MMTDVLIIGAGLAGLSAGLACQARGIDCRVLEAGGEIGGRAITRRTASGAAADMGGHWLHGDNTPLKGLIARYGLAAHEDEGPMFICEDGDVRQASEDDWLDAAIDQARAGRIRLGLEPDCPLPDLARDERGRRRLSEFALMWDGVEPPLSPSALEFLTDENTPGGQQIGGGMGALTRALAQAIGYDRVRLHTAVTRIVSISDGVAAEASDGTRWNARRMIFTGSVGVITSGMVAFEPPLSRGFRDHLAGLVMGEMGKIVIEVEPAFLAERGIAPDTSLLLLDATPPHFCHVHSQGLPLISLYVSGQRAENIERLNAAQALGYVSTLLRPYRAMNGFEAHMVGDPLISHWIGNPYTRGAYSALLPGHRRSGPRMEGAVCFCGEAFDERFPASLAGAWRSGEAAVKLLCETGLLAEMAN